VTDANGDTAAIEQAFTAQKTLNDSFKLQYTVKLDVNGYVSGFGLASTLNNATPYSQFIFKADQFAFGAPGLSSVYPFVIQASPTSVNGIDVPAGVYMDAAYIKTATITAAKIASVKADSIQSGYLAAVTSHTGALYNGVNAYTLSTNPTTGVVTATATNYTMGSDSFGTGYYLSSNKMFVGSPTKHMMWDGAALTVRGTVYANAGQIGGNTIDSTSIHSGTTGYGTGAGFYLGSNGTFSLSDKLTWNGSVLNINGGGTFTGNVSGGQFTTGAFTGYAWPAVNNYGTYLGPSGLLIGNANNGKYLQVTQDGNIYTPGFNVVDGTMTVNQANVINTLNLAGNAVTVPASAYSGGFIEGYTLLEAQAIGISSSGGAALLIFGAHVYSNQHEGLYLMLTRDGINIFQVGPGPAYNTKVRGEGMETGTVVDTPGAGYHVYRLYVGNPNGYYVSCQARCITYLEVKR
jgi:hypothetical protein